VAANVCCIALITRITFYVTDGVYGTIARLKLERTR